MKIAIDLNDVIRDFYDKFHEIYCNYNDVDENEFPIPEITDQNILPLYNKFSSLKDMYQFIYDEAAQPIFANAGLLERTIMGILEKFFIEVTDEGHELYITSREFANSVKATYFFLGKYGCPVNKVIFEKNYDELWKHFDVIITANTIVIQSKPEDKMVIKINRKYNELFEVENSFDTLSQCISDTYGFLDLIEK